MTSPGGNRSIVRFLLPMADIMALLFSFFLLLPHLEQDPSKAPTAAAEMGSPWVWQEQERLREELQRLKRRNRLPVDERLMIVVLDIDGDTGELLLLEGDSVKRLNAASIDPVIQTHLAQATAEDRELFYLLRVPRPDEKGSRPHPTVADEINYRRWFGRRKVDFRIDYPRLAE